MTQESSRDQHHEIALTSWEVLRFFNFLPPIIVECEITPMRRTVEPKRDADGEISDVH